MGSIDKELISFTDSRNELIKMKEIDRLIEKLVKIKEIAPGFSGCIIIHIHKEKSGSIEISKKKLCKELGKKLN